MIWFHKQRVRNILDVCKEGPYIFKILLTKHVMYVNSLIARVHGLPFVKILR